MATYSVSLPTVVTSSGTVTTVAARVLLRAGSYAIKITNMKFTVGGVSYITSSGNYSSGFAGAYTLNHYVNSTISGGIVYTPQPMREGANASSATVRYSTLVSNTGGGTLTYTPGTACSATGTALAMAYLTTNVQYQPPSDLLIAPASVIELAPLIYTVGSATEYSFSGDMQIYFDEYHLARSV